jgi:uncharacterized protein
MGTNTDAEGMILAYRDSPPDPETVARNRQTLLDALDQIKVGNWDAFWAIFDADVTFHEAACMPYGGAHRGLEAAKRAYGSISDVFELGPVILEAIPADRDIVILYQSVTFKVRANGQTRTLPVSELFRFRDGKVIEWRALYFDSNALAEAIAGRG